MVSLRRLSATAFLIGGALFLAACGTGGSSPSSGWDGPGPDPSNEIQITVINQNLAQATIYAIWGAGGRVRLGIVNSNDTETFTTTWRAPDLTMEMRLLAAGTYGTNSIPVSPGEMFELVLTPGMDRYRPIR